MYFDNAATTVVKPTQVAEAMFKVISSQKYGNPSRGSHEYAINSLSIVNKCRQNIKKLFGLREENEVVFTANATEALNIAIKGTLSEGDHVLATELDHNSVLRPIYQLEKMMDIHSLFVK